ncbi:hypothetical protein ACFWIW_10975 [Amycolatopsis sp. NPDC058340]|uniref:hypothetical protein n=1 Tax=Amycolatopsis sp. NPDC058340 TaxID=3346453 RepID=UPI003651A237
MTSNSKDITLPSAAAQPDRIGQGTAVEQSRAIAEVQGAIIVAQRVPRNVAKATAAMRESCKQKFLAEKSFYAFPRAGGQVTGMSVYLARELARCWGNVQYGVDELRRDDEFGQSEMLAWAWDVETNTRVSMKFIVPHTRDRKEGGPVRLTDSRDIYESNANAGARRVRECITNILPPWFVDEAKDLARKTLVDGGGVPLQKRITDLIERFAELGVSLQQLEKKQGRGSNAWTALDVANLTVIGRSLANREIQIEEAFEPDMPSASDFKNPETVPAQKPAPAAEVVPPVEEVDGGESAKEAGQSEEPETEDGAEEAGPEPKVASVDVAKLVNLLGANGVKARADQVAVIKLMTGSKIGAFRDLTVSQHTYLMTRIAALVEDGSFAETVKKAMSGATS